ncbi:MAG: response regulator transcription factor [Anaerolineales bacterium]|nr:response regulator transcription factor [Anaerolineales bacterium]
MKSLIPKHIREFFKKVRIDEESEQREFSSDLAFNLDIQSQTQQRKHDNEQENLRRWKYLTQREQEVVALVCMGKRNYEIGEILGITPGTAKSHVENILQKINFRDRHEIRLAYVDWDFETWWQDHHQ